MARGNDELDRARDELFSHIHRCNVLGSTPEQQAEWLHDTVSYLGERFPGLTEENVAELQAMGERFCQPVIPHGAENTALDESGEGALVEPEAREQPQEASVA